MLGVVVLVIRLCFCYVDMSLSVVCLIMFCYFFALRYIFLLFGWLGCGACCLVLICGVVLLVLLFVACICWWLLCWWGGGYCGSY